MDESKFAPIDCKPPLSTYWETRKPCDYCGQKILHSEISSRLDMTSPDGHEAEVYMHQECLSAFTSKTRLRWVP